MAKKRVRHHVNPLAVTIEHFFDGFSTDRSIIVDIGADRGEFTQQLLEKFGDTKNFIVCEIRKPLADKLREKFLAYKNVVVFDGDIVRNFDRIIKPSVEKGIMIEDIYVNFPDPWLKDRHKKRRVITEKFICSKKEWMPKETRWIFQTDQQKLWEETVDMLQNSEGVAVTFFHEPPYGATTKWENAKMAQGEKIYRLSFYMQ